MNDTIHNFIEEAIKYSTKQKSINKLKKRKFPVIYYHFQLFYEQMFQIYIL